MSERLEDIAAAMVANGKGILAADESSATIKKRFDTIGLEFDAPTAGATTARCSSAPTMRCAATSPASSSMTRRCARRPPTARRWSTSSSATGAVPGIKVDAGAKPLAAHPGETITEGLDGLRERLAEYYKLGARFAKWRGVISISDDLPTWGAVKQNAQALARYAALCQEAGIVPIVEPEVLMDGQPGNHSIDRCYDVTEWVLKTVFAELYDARVASKAWC